MGRGKKFEFGAACGSGGKRPGRRLNLNLPLLVTHVTKPVTNVIRETPPTDLCATRGVAVRCETQDLFLAARDAPVFLCSPCLNLNTLSLSMPLLELIAYVSRDQSPFLSNSHTILNIFPFRTPDVTVRSQASPPVSLEVRYLLFPFISSVPSQHHFRA